MKFIIHCIVICFLLIPLVTFTRPPLIHKKQDIKTTPLADFDQVVFQWTKSFAEVIHIINKKYHEPVNPEKAMINAINAFISTLDPHSSFMDPKSYKDIIETTQGEFYGIGVIIDNMKENEQEFLKIIDTIPGGPADKAGIRAEDIIVQINDDSLKGMSVEEIIAKLKGKRNTDVHIKIKRANNPELLSFTLSRDIVKEQDALCYYFKDHGIYYLSLRMFTENSVKQLEQLLKKCQSQHSKGLILDLRNNSGGLLNAVVDIAGLFLQKNSVVVITQERDKKVEYTTTRDPIEIGSIPVFILINNFTASAAEILAGCLQIHSDASTGNGKKNPQVFLVGSKTFGKGSVQEVIPIPNDCAAKVTTALYYLPNNISIQSVGIEPDFIIEQRLSPTKEMQWFNKFFGHESSLKNAIKHKDTLLINEKKETESSKAPEKEKSWQEKKQEQIGSDYIVLSTLRLLEMYSMAKKAFPEQVSTRKDSINFLKKNYVTSDSIAMEEITI
jgi:carboxyl-terminal processing protease